MDIEQLRYTQVDSPISNIYDIIKSVQINPGELCNRTCSFCPRGSPGVYPNQKKFIDTKTVHNICSSLLEIEFKNRIAFVGFGEPLLHPDIYNCIKIIRDTVNPVWLEINTNGDKLTPDVISRLSRAGCNQLNVSMYDKDISDKIDQMKCKTNINIVCRHSYNPEDNYGLNLVNRTDLAMSSGYSTTTSPCYIPFYKLMIDWDGSVLLCDNDWSKSNKFGNVNEQSLKDIWSSDRYQSYLKKLFHTRSDCHPCKNCTAIGILRGVESAEYHHKYNK